MRPFRLALSAALLGALIVGCDTNPDGPKMEAPPADASSQPAAPKVVGKGKRSMEARGASQATGAVDY